MLDILRPLAFRTGLVLAVLALCAAAACNDDPPESERTQGGESALDRAGNKVDRAHQNFKREVKPAAEWVDEKTKKAVGEGKKAVNKTADAIDENVGDD